MEVSEEQFVRAMKNRRFLRKLMTTSLGSENAFKVPLEFDYSKSTKDNYANEDLADFHGEFTNIRRSMDAQYHGNYTRERQLWQDEVIKRVSVRIDHQEEPWVVYTCGAMGAGKGFALAYMSKIGAFPLESIVHIDPDLFKQLMPEWQRYVSVDERTAGTMCHRESGYIQEIAQEVAMRASQNVWVDGSLRDGDWFCQVFDDHHERFKNYRIAIFLVSASEDVAWERCQRRAVQTGRSVPRDLFLDSTYAPDHVLSKLTPKVDFVARINNDGAEPRLEAFESVDYSGEWDAIAEMFGGGKIEDGSKIADGGSIEGTSGGGKGGEVDGGNKKAIFARISEGGEHEGPGNMPAEHFSISLGVPNFVELEVLLDLKCLRALIDALPIAACLFAQRLSMSLVVRRWPQGFPTGSRTAALP